MAKSGVIGRSKAIRSYFSRLFPMRAKLHLSRHLSNLTGLFLAASGSITLVWVGQLTWYDMTAWGKDIALIFFGSRTGEAIGLGIDMKVIHYFLMGLALLVPGSLIVLRRQIKTIRFHLRRPLLPQKGKEQKNKREEFQAKPSGKDEGSSGCPYHFGYLESRPKNAPIPQECLICLKILECMQSRNF